MVVFLFCNQKKRHNNAGKDIQSHHVEGVFERFLPAILTLGDFLSVFLLTRTGLSYFTRDAFGGIILKLDFLPRNSKLFPLVVLQLFITMETEPHGKGLGAFHRVTALES